jgi:membrane protein
VKHFFRAVGRVLTQAVRRWIGGHASQLGAALAYYFVFSIAPLLVVAIAVASWVCGPAAVRGEVANQLESFMGADAAATVQELLRSAGRSHSASWITGLSTVIILFAASNGVAALKNALNSIWGVVPAPHRSWWWTVWDWARAMLLVLASGGLLVMSLVLTIVFSSLAAYAPDAIDGFLPRAQLINLAVSVTMMFLLFAMIFKWLPDVKISWSDVWFGAAVTSVLFLLGKEVLGVYLGHVAAVSPYGAGSSLAMLLLWAYYSSQILLLGGELVRAYADQAGSRIEPKNSAVTVNPAVGSQSSAALRETLKSRSS